MAEPILNDFTGDKKTLPQTLNVLTILTFIGCGLGYVFTLAMPGLMKFSLKMMDKAASSGTELSPKDAAEIEKGRAAIELVQSHMTPLIIMGLITISLCLVGAIMMRKLKKDGYWIYIAGELLPIAGNYFIIGNSQFVGVSNILLGLIIPVVFVALYSTQKKNLVN